MKLKAQSSKLKAGAFVPNGFRAAATTGAEACTLYLQLKNG
jgi:hypothetical protein